MVAPQPVLKNKFTPRTISRAKRKTQAAKINNKTQLKPNVKNTKKVVKIGQKSQYKAKSKNET